MLHADSGMSGVGRTLRVESADFDACLVLLTQPAEDYWSPRDFSAPPLDTITKVAVEAVTLDRAGDFPLEDPGLSIWRTPSSKSSDASPDSSTPAGSGRARTTSPMSEPGRILSA